MSLQNLDTRLTWDTLPKITSFAPYRTDVPLNLLVSNLVRYKGMNLNLEPDFQRSHVWDRIKQIRYVEFVLKGGKGPDIYFNHPGWMKNSRGDFVIVDGKQRLTALLDFLHGKFPVFQGHLQNRAGWRHDEIFPSILSRITVGFSVHSLKTRREVLQWYLEINEGYVAHTPEELFTVRQLLRIEQEKDV